MEFALKRMLWPGLAVLGTFAAPWILDLAPREFETAIALAVLLALPAHLLSIAWWAAWAAERGDRVRLRVLLIWAACLPLLAYFIWAVMTLEDVAMAGAVVSGFMLLIAGCISVVATMFLFHRAQYRDDPPKARDADS